MTLDRAWYWTKRRFLQVKKYEQNACVNKEILLHVIVCFCFFPPKERRLETVPRQTLNDRSSSALQSNTFTSGKPIRNFSLRYQYTTKQKIKRESMKCMASNKENLYWGFGIERVKWFLDYLQHSHRIRPSWRYVHTNPMGGSQYIAL